jgi:putative sigma-54 modulation protein
MKIEFTGRQTEIPNEVRRLVERKLVKVAKVMPGLTRAHVILTADKHRRIAEVSAHSRQVDLSAVEVSTNPRLSISNALEKLLRQAQRRRDKRRQRKGAASPRKVETGVAAEGPEEAAPRVVVRSRRLAVKPMTLDEAALVVEEKGDGVVVYRDAVTERVRVLYRRKDGSLGLIEPEV